MTQFVDIAVAFGFGLLCLALIISISPVVSREAAVQEAAQAKADIALSSYVQHVGLPFLNSSTPASICNSTEQDSNSTLVSDRPCGWGRFVRRLDPYWLSGFCVAGFEFP